MTTPTYDATPAGPHGPDGPDGPDGQGVPPATELAWHELLRGGRPGGWRVVVGIPFLLALVLFVQAAPVLIYTVYLAAVGKTYEQAQDMLTGSALTPAFLGIVNVGWALTIPSVLLVLWVMHRLRPGWGISVVGRLRWRWLLTCVGLALVALVANLVVASLLPAGGETSEVGGLNDFTAQTRDFLLVVVLLTPLQAAGEEFAFRGYLTQAVGGLTRRLGPQVSRGAAVVVPALLFATAHGIGQDLPVFFDRFAFGLVAGILVIATGGLEAGIALHALNNLFAFGLALAFGDMSSALEPTAASWWPILATITQSVVFTALVLWAARRTGLQTRTTPVVLVAPDPRV